MAYTNQIVDMKKLHEEFREKLRNDPVLLKKFIREISGPETRKLPEQERDHMLTIFRLIEPIESSNNQRSWTDVFEHAGKTYHVHYFDDETVIEEILPDDIQQD